jgi:hypothetical protein
LHQLKRLGLPCERFPPALAGRSASHARRKGDLVTRCLFTTLPTNDLGLLMRSLPVARELSAVGQHVDAAAFRRKPYDECNGWRITRIVSRLAIPTTDMLQQNTSGVKVAPTKAA